MVGSKGCQGVSSKATSRFLECRETICANTDVLEVS